MLFTTVHNKLVSAGVTIALNKFVSDKSISVELSGLHATALKNPESKVISNIVAQKPLKLGTLTMNVSE